MSSFASNIHMPQLVSGHPFGLHTEAIPPPFAKYGAHHAKPPRFFRADTLSAPFPPHGASPIAGAEQQRHISRDVLEQRGRTPCKHFEHHLGWCPYGTECHFLHDYSRLASSRGPSMMPSPASSATTSLRSSPVPSMPLYPPHVPAFPGGFAAAPPPPHIPRVLHRHAFTPRTVGGTTYFPIRLDEARLGYVTPTGVEVFTDHY